MTKSNFDFDRSYWPDCGTIIDVLPTDLQDLWENYEDQATVFVAEALLSHETVWLDWSTGKLVTSIWGVGGDMITVKACVATEREAARYGGVVSDAQREEIAGYHKALDRLQSSIDTARKMIDAEISAYDAAKEKKK